MTKLLYLPTGEHLTFHCREDAPYPFSTEIENSCDRTLKDFIYNNNFILPKMVEYINAKYNIDFKTRNGIISKLRVEHIEIVRD